MFQRAAHGLRSRRSLRISWAKSPAIALIFLRVLSPKKSANRTRLCKAGLLRAGACRMRATNHSSVSSAERVNTTIAKCAVNDARALSRHNQDSGDTIVKTMTSARTKTLAGQREPLRADTANFSNDATCHVPWSKPVHTPNSCRAFTPSPVIL